MTQEEASNKPSGVSIHAGFPNPAADKSLGSLDLNQLLIQNSASTFLFRLRGHEWEQFGIFDSDIVIVDRAPAPHKNDLVIWWNEHSDNFAISKLMNVEDDANIWGVVTAVIHRFRGEEK